MMTCLRKRFGMIEETRRRERTIGMDPKDPAVLDMLCKADYGSACSRSEERARCRCARLKHAAITILVVEVAIVRPGPSRAAWFTLT